VTRQAPAPASSWLSSAILLDLADGSITTETAAGGGERAATRADREGQHRAWSGGHHFGACFGAHGALALNHPGFALQLSTCLPCPGVMNLPTGPAAAGGLRAWIWIAGSGFGALRRPDRLAALSSQRPLLEVESELQRELTGKVNTARGRGATTLVRVLVHTVPWL
jgi:hypothetical protein